MLRAMSGEGCFPDASHSQDRHDPATVSGDPLLHPCTFLLAPIKIADIGHLAPILVRDCAWHGLLLFIDQPHLCRCLAEGIANVLAVRGTRKTFSTLPSTNSFGINPNFFRQLPL